MSTRFVNIVGGRLQAVRRGVSPSPPEGYKRSSYDPFIFEPLLIPCKYRCQKEKPNRTCGCKAGTLFLYCNEREDFIIPKMCEKQCTIYGTEESK